MEQGQINGAANETWTHSYRFANQACYYTIRGALCSSVVDSEE